MYESVSGIVWSPMTKASSAPATKQDLHLLQQDFHLLREGVDQFKTDVMQSFQELREDMRTWKSEVIHEFHVVAEDMRHDAFGIQKDRLENHEDRIVRLEHHAGLSRSLSA